MCAVEIQKLRHDRTELYTRAVQPALWLLIFGETFTRLHAIPTGGVPYLDFLAPGIIAQSAMFIAIFYGIMIIWERDSGVLTKLLVTPTPRAALVTGKAFAAGTKSVIQAPMLNDALGLRAGSASILAKRVCIARADGAPSVSLRRIASPNSSRTMS